MVQEGARMLTMFTRDEWWRYKWDRIVCIVKSPIEYIYTIEHRSSLQLVNFGELITGAQLTYQNTLQYSFASVSTVLV